MKYCPWCSSEKPMYGRFYNPKTHIAFQCGLVGGATITTHEAFYLDDVLCGLYCDIDGKNCEKGACTIDACENGYKNLGILKTSFLGFGGLELRQMSMESVVCYNNLKYYNVFEPNKKNLTILKDIKPVNK